MQDMMPLFKRALLRWGGHVKNKTGSTTYRFKNSANGEFTLEVGGEWGSYSKIFTRQMVWGTSAQKLPSGRRMVKRTCDFVRDIVKEVNAEKGKKK